MSSVLEQISLVETAQDHLREAIACLEIYVRRSGDNHTKAYILDHLEIMCSEDHGFFSRDPNLDGVLEGLRAQEQIEAQFERTPEHA